MAHSIHVGFLSVNDFVAKMICAVAQKNIISAKNIYVSDTEKERCASFTEQGMNVLTDDAAVLMKSEIVVIAAPRREFGTVLAPICALTRGKIIIAMTDGIDCQYVLERVTRGTLVVSAVPMQAPDGSWSAHIEYSAGFPEYMKGACEDIIALIQEKE